MRDVNSQVRFVFFGTSIMEHFEAYASRLDSPYALPAVGERIAVERHRKRGWVHMLYLRLQTSHPDLRLTFDNQGLGGATSRDILRLVREVTTGQDGPDLAILGVGINDVWRCFQGRPELAVHPDEYGDNYDALLRILSGWARRTVCVTETPFGWDDTIDITAMNRQLAAYNATAVRLAGQHEADIVDLWHPLLAAADQLAPDLSLWSDGAHLSELGDTTVARCVDDALSTVLSDLIR